MALPVSALPLPVLPPVQLPDSFLPEVLRMPLLKPLWFHVRFHLFQEALPVLPPVTYQCLLMYRHFHIEILRDCVHFDLSDPTAPILGFSHLLCGMSSVSVLSPNPGIQESLPVLSVSM